MEPVGSLPAMIPTPIKKNNDQIKELAEFEKGARIHLIKNRLAEILKLTDIYLDGESVRDIIFGTLKEVKMEWIDFVLDEWGGVRFKLESGKDMPLEENRDIARKLIELYLAETKDEESRKNVKELIRKVDALIKIINGKGLEPFILQNGEISFYESDFYYRLNNLVDREMNDQLEELATKSEILFGKTYGKEIKLRLAVNEIAAKKLIKNKLIAVPDEIVRIFNQEKEKIIFHFQQKLAGRMDFFERKDYLEEIDEQIKHKIVISNGSETLNMYPRMQLKNQEEGVGI